MGNTHGEPSTIAPPHGKWKGDIFGCFDDGCLAPYLWCSICIPICSMGQVMHRLKLDWTGQPARMAKTIHTFQIVATLACLYYISQVIYSLYSWMYTNDTWMSNFTTADLQVTTGAGNSLMIFFIGFMASNLFFLIWSLCALTRTRMNVRERYNIRGSACGDFCCALWCRCCTVAQLHRHTGEYENHQSLCCSKTGLHEHINVV